MKLGTVLLASAVAMSMALVAAPPSLADTAPVDPANPATPVTVSADALPTVQIDGIVWQQVIIGNVAYAVGQFNTARPAGAAPGTNTVARNNILAYDLTTGNLITSFTASLNGMAKTIAASPDGSKLFVGGAFSQVNGVSRPYVAALNPTTGALITSWAPKVNSRVVALTVSNNAVYMGGWFSGVGSVSRPKLAAVSTSNASLLSWNPVPAGGDINTLLVSPDDSKVVVGGSFTTLNGSSNPGYGLGAVNTGTGGLLPWAANGLVRNGGTQAAILSLASDGTSVYGTGYVFGDGGNLEGTFSADWSDGAIKWVEDCHGDTYGVYASDTAVYTVSHAHYCGNVDGFPQTSPKWTFHHALAFSKAATGTITDDPMGYYNFAGNPRPSLLQWYPDFAVGTFTGASQAAWDITGNNQYIVAGGEFPSVNGKAQQGLVRFAVKGSAPNKQGPVIGGSAFNPSVISTAPGTARVSWQANWDKDNQNLNYQLIRDGKTATPIYTKTQDSDFWRRPGMGYVDTGLAAGSTHTYQIIATDAFGNIAKSTPVSVTTATEGSVSDYAKGVLADGAADYWRLGEASGATAIDWAGWSDMSLGAGVTRGSAGAITGDANTATAFGGTNTGVGATQTQIQGPDTFTAEAWFNTTSTTGGKILGFGNSSTGDSSAYDRHVYMDNAGRIIFGVYTGNVDTLQSAAGLNDGQWHQVIASLGSNGMVLYIDGKRVAKRSDVTAGQPYTGYWRIGGDNLNAWPSQPRSSYFQGSIDEVSIYPAVLGLAQVQNHFQASGRTLDLPTAPADNYGKAVFQAGPDLFWRLGEANGTKAADSGAAGNTGTYVSGTTLGRPGAIAGVTNTAVAFDGSSGLLSSDTQFSNPTVYSQELWFNTTTTNGGKLIGFGDSNTGLSNSYDRHVYMENSGQLTFGVWTGQTNTITSPQPYNDGSWHHMVATQSSDGMKLYVDGQQVGSNPQTQAQAYNGYWRIGADRTWGPQPYFAGTIDEVAVYSTALTASDVSAHFALGTGSTANQSPVAAFSSAVANLTATFDGSASADPDGTVNGYAWDFGDSSPAGTGATPSHTYAAAGTYQVKLTVTDDKGATGTLTKPVTVTAPADQPLAQDAFNRTVSGGFGRADIGGNWTIPTGASNYSVANGGATISVAAGATRSAYLNAVSSNSALTQFDVSLDKVSDGGGAFVSAIGRNAGNSNDYRAKLWIAKTGGMVLYLTKTVAGAETILTTKSLGLTYITGDTVRIQMAVTGTSPTTLSAKVWKIGTAEPATWSSTTTDSTAALQVSGSVGVLSYVSGSSLNGPVKVTLRNWLTSTQP
jgi:PKD repeat protein